MPHPYSWSPTRLVPDSASQVKIRTVDDQPATLTTPVSVTEGEIAFALAAPGRYKIIIQKGTERYVGLFNVDVSGVDIEEPEQAEYTRNAPLDATVADAPPVLPVKYIAEDGDNPGLYKISEGDTSGGRLVTVDDDFKFPAAVEEELDSTYGTPKLGIVDVSNSALLVSGKTVALCGDSITDGAGSTNVTVDSYRAYLGKIVGTARVKIVDHGVAGESAAGLLARVPAIIAENPAVAVIMIGTNASTNLSTYKTDYTAILDQFLTARIPVIINLLPPRGTAASSEAERTGTYNLWLRYIAAKRGLPLVDVYSPLVDPATGLMLAAYDSDGTHPTPAGHLQIAKTVAPVLQTVVANPLPWVVAPGAPGLVSNPLMAGGAVSTPPTSWTSTGVTGGGTGTVGTVAADGVLKAGSWMKITADASAVGVTVTVGRYAAISPTPAPGDVILIAASVKQDVGSETAATVQFADGSTVITIPMQSAGVADPGKVLATYTIPGGGHANPRVRCITAAAAGTVKAAYFGEVQVWNLTQLGLTELAT